MILHPLAAKVVLRLSDLHIIMTLVMIMYIQHALGCTMSVVIGRKVHWKMSLRRGRSTLFAGGRSDAGRFVVLGLLLIIVRAAVVEPLLI